MKLIVFHPFLYTRGGAERVVLEVAKHFNAKIYCSRYEKKNTFKEFSDLDVEVLPKGITRFIPSNVPMRIRDAAIAGEQFYNFKIPEDYDVANAQGTPSEWIRNKNENVLWFCHTPNREAFDLYEWRMSKRNILQKALYWSFIQPYKMFEFSTVPKIEKILANSMNTQSRLKKYLKRKDVEIVNPGVDVEKFSNESYEKFFFYPSRITPEKRFEYAIKAFSLFKKKMGPEAEKWKLIIAGALMKERKEHVEYYKKIKGLLGNMGKIIINPKDEEFMKLYRTCYSVVYTPVDEDFGIIPLEALASNKPCIAVNEGGPKEIIGQGMGYLVKNEKEMAEKMVFLADNPNLPEQMGKEGRAHVEKNFTWKVFLEKFEKAAKEMAKK